MRLAVCTLQIGSCCLLCGVSLFLTQSNLIISSAPACHFLISDESNSRGASQTNRHHHDNLDFATFSDSFGLHYTSYQTTRTVRPQFCNRLQTAHPPNAANLVEPQIRPAHNRLASPSLRRFDQTLQTTLMSRNLQFNSSALR